MIRCHYDVLGVPRDADDATIKRAHRTQALRHHPDKNLDKNPEVAAEQFRLVQQAYECLSDPSERRYYDDHRDAILQGWTASSHNGDGDNDEYEFFVDLVHYMHPSCYKGLDDTPEGFFAVYRTLFQTLNEKEGNSKLPDFGDSTTEWKHVSQFYATWLAFSSELSFAWADEYDTSKDAVENEHRRVKRAMADANAKARKAARKARNDDVRALVKFVQRRDVRVQARQQLVEQQRLEQERLQKEQAQAKKRQAREARKEWREQAEQELAAAEEEDRIAGRVRLADLDDDYDYGGGKKKKGKKKGKGKKQVVVESSSSDDELENEMENEPVVLDDDVAKAMNGLTVNYDDDDSQEPQSAQCDPDRGASSTVSEANHTVPEDEDGSDEDSSSEEEEEDEPDVWRCECCRKDFKSRGQMENHFSSKKHKQAFKSYQTKLQSSAG